jgi:hypothetical protein
VPPLPPAQNVLFYKFRYTLGEDTSTGWGIHARYAGTAPNNAQLAVAAQSLFYAWTTPYAHLTSSDTALTAISIQDLSSATGGFGIFEGTMVGTSTDAFLPAQACAVHNHVIQRRYRGGKPRCFIPVGTQIDLTDAQNWKASAVTAFHDAFGAFMQSLTTVPPGGTSITGLVSVSYYDGFTSIEDPITHRWRNVPKLREGAPVVDPITSTVVSPRIGTQRRRVSSG